MLGICVVGSVLSNDTVKCGGQAGKLANSYSRCDWALALNYAMHKPSTIVRESPHLSAHGWALLAPTGLEYSRMCLPTPAAAGFGGGNVWGRQRGLSSSLGPGRVGEAAGPVKLSGPWTCGGGSGACQALWALDVWGRQRGPARSLCPGCVREEPSKISAAGV
jgi:hypothetical protein